MGVSLWSWFSFWDGLTGSQRGNHHVKNGFLKISRAHELGDWMSSPASIWHTMNRVSCNMFLYLGYRLKLADLLCTPDAGQVKARFPVWRTTNRTECVGSFLRGNISEDNLDASKSARWGYLDSPAAWGRGFGHLRHEGCAFGSGHIPEAAFCWIPGWREDLLFVGSLYLCPSAGCGTEGVATGCSWID